MLVRFPKFDASRFRPHWAPNPEFAQSYNGNSVVPAHIEPYLIKVMTRALKELDPHHARLKQEMEIFIAQETQHCQQHVAFNKLMYSAGYEGLKPIEKDYRADYARFLAEKSLKFNLAYCEGFEASGCSAAEGWFHGDFDALIEGADPYAVELWKWHLAEEFEHRTVCYDVFKVFYCRGFWGALINGYFYRVWAFFYSVRHISSYIKRCTTYLLAKDREHMSAEELRKSLAREKAARRVITRSSLRRLVKVLSPFYNPRHKQMPQNMSALLARYT